ncbi:MAG TPA: Crp/Fnr family transcriptional regulator [Clostridiales bacterium]|nr:Crp/Fnr family transcriptional regulator [Clostridiales bacterium]
MDKYYPTIEESFLFNEIDKKSIDHLLKCLGAELKNYDKDEYLFLTGDKINNIGIVVEGIVEIIKESLAGDRHIIAFLEASDMFAEGIVSTINKISPVTARVQANSKVLWIPYDKIIRACGNVCDFHLILIQNMITILGEKNVILNKKIELLTLKGMRAKIAKHLLNESYDKGKQTFQIVLNRLELADYLNVSRTSMCRELSRMKEDGVIDYYGKSFKILKEEELIKCLD